MARVFRVLAVTVTALMSLFLLWMASVFGSCEGWKGTGTCPRVPIWDWEVFWLGFWSGILPTLSVRLGRDRLLRGLGESLAAGAILGALVVLVTAY